MPFVGITLSHPRGQQPRDGGDESLMPLWSRETRPPLGLSTLDYYMRVKHPSISFISLCLGVSVVEA